MSNKSCLIFSGKIFCHPQSSGGQDTCLTIPVEVKCTQPMKMMMSSLTSLLIRKMFLTITGGDLIIVL